MSSFILLIGDGSASVLRRPGGVTGHMVGIGWPPALLFVKWQTPIRGGVAPGGMTLQTHTASALVWALDRAHQHAGAAAALAAAGLDLSGVDRFDGLSDDFDELVGRGPGETSGSEGLPRGSPAGRVAAR